MESTKEILSEIKYLEKECEILEKRSNKYYELFLKHRGALEHTQSMLEIRTKELKEHNENNEQEEHQK